MSIEDWAISENFSGFIHKVDERNRGLRNQIIDDTFIVAVALDDMEVKSPHSIRNAFLIVDQFSNA